MQLTLRPAIERGRNYAFPAAWAALLATGVVLYKPLPTVDAAPYLSFGVGSAEAREIDQAALFVPEAEPATLTFVRHEWSEPDDVAYRAT